MDLFASNFCLSEIICRFQNVTQDHHTDAEGPRPPEEGNGCRYEIASGKIGRRYWNTVLSVSVRNVSMRTGFCNESVAGFIWKENLYNCPL